MYKNLKQMHLLYSDKELNRANSPDSESSHSRSSSRADSRMGKQKSKKKAAKRKEKELAAIAEKKKQE